MKGGGVVEEDFEMVVTPSITPITCQSNDGEDVGRMGIKVWGMSRSCLSNTHTENNNFDIHHLPQSGKRGENKFLISSCGKDMERESFRRWMGDEIITKSVLRRVRSPVTKHGIDPVHISPLISPLILWFIPNSPQSSTMRRM
ncbi:MAG TPA: hypothetical protein EYO73_05855 [Sulfurimonas sp.]|nr:hypothetical protein [Sulfurimonas sp.]